METRAGVVVLRGHRELYERTWHLFDKAREVTFAASDVRTWASHNQPPMQGRIRKLYRPGVLLDPTSAQHARHVAATGAQVRITTSDLNETIIVDRRVAILAGDDRTFTVVWIPNVVQAVLTLFNTVWSQSKSLADYERAYGDLWEIAPRILELLGSGAPDTRAAKAMGMPLRIYRRRVNDLLATLGADSRFQAGARARELGLI
ncbi:DNA-binding response regulator [Kibdelosporangium persicum]|uniref:DNA-binding response regulator n=1 Tax=Kibdelosporangium persicum TaxID=2698649 RepID=UPI001565A0A8|nr:DNA-binding response regulator [Kibdelosporangium persicum]